MAYKVITIGDQEVPMMALASVDVYFKKVFREDPLALLGSAGDNDAAKAAITFPMGFIMAKFAELKDRKKMLQLTEDEYLDWLEQFEYGDYVAAAPQMLELYYSQKKITVKEKNGVRP